MKLMNVVLSAMIGFGTVSLFAIPVHAEVLNGRTLSAALGTISAEDVKATDGITSENLTSTSSTYFGLKGGYSLVEEKNVGFIARASLLTKIGGDFKDFTLFRPELDVSYGLTDKVYTFAGINVEQFLANSTFSKMGVGLGWQLGAGVKISEQSFVELQYGSTHHSFSLNGIDFDINFKSLDASVGFIF